MRLVCVDGRTYTHACSGDGDGDGDGGVRTLSEVLCEVAESHPDAAAALQGCLRCTGPARRSQGGDLGGGVEDGVAWEVYAASGTRCYNMEDRLPSQGHFEICARLRGGKGGFGSLLRALGNRRSNAETDNIEACRDLSGRRLRHVHEEKMLNEWMAKGQERREEAERRRKLKLERALAAPKHAFDSHGLAIELNQQSTSVHSAVSTAMKKGAKRDAATAHPDSASTRRGVSLQDEWDSATTTSDNASEDEGLVAKKRKQMTKVSRHKARAQEAAAAMHRKQKAKQQQAQEKEQQQQEQQEQKEEQSEEEQAAVTTSEAGKEQSGEDNSGEDPAAKGRSKDNHTKKHGKKGGKKATSKAAA